jgi:hypothetical protein
MATIIGRLSEIWTTTGSASATVTKAACDQKSGTVYHITDAAKRILDPDTTSLVYGNNVLVTTGYHMHAPVGEIHFDSAPTTPVTITYKYFAQVEVAYAQDWELSQERKVYDTTSLGDTVRTFVDGGIVEWSGSFNRLYDASQTWMARVVAGTVVTMKFYTDQPSALVYVGYVHPVNWGLSVPLDLEKEKWSFTGEGELFYQTSEA